VHNVTLVTVVDGRKNLLYYLSGIDFTELLLLSYLVEELSSVTKFSDQEVAFLILEEFVKFQNIWMIKLLKNVDFIQELFSLFVRDVPFVYYLHSSQSHGLLVQTFPDFSISASTNARRYFIEIFDVTCILFHKGSTRTFDLVER